MRIVVDLDGTICPLRAENQSYADLEVLPGAQERLKELKEAGHYIIIQTARNMGTQKGNLGKVMQNIGKITLEWLERYEIPFDEIYFGKPNGQLYIDDRAVRFMGWEQLDEAKILALAREK